MIYLLHKLSYLKKKIASTKSPLIKFIPNTKLFSEEKKCSL